MAAREHAEEAVAVAEILVWKDLVQARLVEFFVVLLEDRLEGVCVARRLLYSVRNADASNVRPGRQCDRRRRVVSGQAAERTAQR